MHASTTSSIPAQSTYSSLDTVCARDLPGKDKAEGPGPLLWALFVLDISRGEHLPWMLLLLLPSSCARFCMLLIESRENSYTNAYQHRRYRSAKQVTSRNTRHAEEVAHRNSV